MWELLAENPTAVVIGATSLNVTMLLGAVAFGVRQEARITAHDMLFEERDKQNQESLQRIAAAAEATDKRVERLETLLLERVVIVRDNPRG